ncbi:MAG: FecR domain-containing protein [Pseudomonadota bacterium]|uniref:FecR family protein n=1 Tax=Sphingomonas sp. ERG5 TaxID=1381597 RepID=UPI00054C30AB|nr:FecR domain-containing protein [Sphingomonas sp. ERG5]
MTRETASEREAEAARWAMRLDAACTPAMEAELAEWLAGDDRRKGALLQAEAALALVGEALRHEHDDGVEAPPPAASILTRRRLIGAAAAALAASVAGGVLLYRPGETYRTALGEVRRVPLADGSIAVVNTQSAVDVTIGNQARTIRLEQGEAWFQVAHDKARPFTVEAGPARVRAVGTAFSVRRFGNGSEILVNEGVVEVWLADAERRPVRLSAGKRAFLADDIRTPIAVGMTEVERGLAWRSGKIDLAGEPLSYAVAEFNRYNDRKLVIADPVLAGERFYGVFRVDDPEGFAVTVHDSLKAPVTLSDRAEIRIGVSAP